MSNMKNALIFFTKVPTPGLTKTRLTTEHGGIFTPEEAAELYRAVMLDTAEVGFRALEQGREQQAGRKVRFRHQRDPGA
ncbi:hypothetical protein [Malonomonas rubra]|uniref:hypothetical protein n=1 Tax=Malonomonas rubra TaxID=57040 RepID=UPI0026EB373D|nr:hypothetical protein [Malonomonas rubra]